MRAGNTKTKPSASRGWRGSEERTSLCHRCGQPGGRRGAVGGGGCEGRHFIAPLVRTNYTLLSSYNFIRRSLIKARSSAYLFMLRLSLYFPPGATTSSEGQPKGGAGVDAPRRPEPARVTALYRQYQLSVFYSARPRGTAALPTPHTPDEPCVLSLLALYVAAARGQRITWTIEPPRQKDKNTAFPNICH